MKKDVKKSPEEMEKFFKDFIKIERRNRNQQPLGPHSGMEKIRLHEQKCFHIHLLCIFLSNF